MVLEFRVYHRLGLAPERCNHNVFSGGALRFVFRKSSELRFETSVGDLVFRCA